LKAEIHYDKLREKLGSVTEGKNDFARNLNLSAARNAIKNKKNDRAVEYYKQALLYDGRDLKVAEEIAGVFAGLEKFDDALELCEKILLSDPQNLEVMTLKTNLLVRLKKYTEAQETIEKISHDESNLKFRQLSADIDAWSGNYDNAIEKYQKLILQFPEDRDLWSQLIHVLSWAKKWPLLLETAQMGKDKIEMNDDTRALLVNAHLSVGEQEKAIEIWKTISRESATWRASALMIVDKFLSQRKLAAAADILGKIVSGSKPAPEAHLLAKLAILYTYREMPGKGFEILNQFSVSPQSEPIFEAAKAEILSLTGRYDDALSIIHTLEGDKEIGLRLHMLELECFYALEKDGMLLEKSSALLQKLSRGEMADKAKILTLRILSQIRIGQYEEARTEIELLSKSNEKDPGPAILTALLLAAERQLEAHEKAKQVLGMVLSGLTAEIEMVRPQLLDAVPLSSWKIADDVAMHHNQEVCTQRAKAEYKAGNYQQSLTLYTELEKEKKDPIYKLGMVECFLGMNNQEEANNIFHQIPLPGLPEKETARYCEALVTLEKGKEELSVGLSLFPEDISQKTSTKAIVAIANVQSGDRAIADGIVKQYLSDQPGNLALFQTILERVGYFDRGRQSQNYEFAKEWLRQAVEQFPADSGLRYQYAKLLATHNDYDMACEQFLALQENDPTDVRCIRWLAQVNSWRHEYDESLRWYDAYIR
ncbi:MAG: tetratricopeptide repeat protein, partial [Candidatus Brocadia sp.]